MVQKAELSRALHISMGSAIKLRTSLTMMLGVSEEIPTPEEPQEPVT